MADDRSDADVPGGERASWFSRHQQAAWIAAGATVLAALITTVVPLLGSDDDTDDAPEPVAAPTSQPSATPDATSAPASADPAQPAPDPSPAGTERWQGRLLLDTEPKDLDAAQPVGVGRSDDGDVYLISRDEIEGWNGTTISVWSGDTTSPPGYEECAGTVHAEGTEQQELTDDAVLCVHTSAGNIARLTLTEVERGTTDYYATFDAVVWEAG